MSETGTLVQWNDERGFGFIETSTGQRIFVHITAIARMVNRPRVGDVVSFVTRPGRDGRLEARSVRVAGANPVSSRRISRGASPVEAKLDWRLPTAGLLAALLVLAGLNDTVPPYLLMAYAVMGLVSLGLYRADKTYAQTGQWRISEAMLLGVDLFGGIIGGLLAQGAFRHKTRKPGYVAATILFTVVHLIWLGGLATGLVTWDEVLAVPALLGAG